jgi:hypothetical protein
LGATTEEEWFNIFISVIQGIPLLYIIIDVELLDTSLAELTESFCWPAAFLKIFDELSERNIKTIIKAALVSYGSPLFTRPMSNECQKLVVPVGGVNSAKALTRIPIRRGGASVRGKALEFGRGATLRGRLRKGIRGN